MKKINAPAAFVKIANDMVAADDPLPDDPVSVWEQQLGPRPTPRSTVEAVMYAVRDRGLGALDEPATKERLGRCDAPARAEINQRIEALIAAGRLAGRKGP
jgi:hypothetical protein